VVSHPWQFNPSGSSVILAPAALQTPILPRLQVLYAKLPGLPENIVHFLAPSVATATFVCASDSSSFSRDLVRHLPALLPNLNSLRIVDRNGESVARAFYKEVIRSFHQLRSFSYKGSMVGIMRISHLATYEQLAHFTIRCRPSPLQQLAAGSYPALESLELKGSMWNLTQLVKSITSRSVNSIQLTRNSDVTPHVGLDAIIAALSSEQYKSLYLIFLELLKTDLRVRNHHSALIPPRSEKCGDQNADVEF
jgi:hypothetical protein